MKSISNINSWSPNLIIWNFESFNWNKFVLVINSPLKSFTKFTKCGYIDVGDGCWRRKVLVTTIRCWWRFLPLFKRAFWSRKVFEGVHLHVMDLLQNASSVQNLTSNLDQIANSNYWKWTKIAFWHMIWTKKAISKRIKSFFLRTWWSRVKIRFRSTFQYYESAILVQIRSKILDQNRIFEASSVRMSSFKHFSGSKSRPPRQSYNILGAKICVFNKNGIFNGLIFVKNCTFTCVIRWWSRWPLVSYSAPVLSHIISGYEINHCWAIFIV